MPSTEDKTPSCYWDACIFLHYVNATPDYLSVLDTLVDEAEQERVKVYTSTLSVAEVAFGQSEQAEGRLDAEIEAKIDGLWHPGSFVQPLQELHFFIVRSARDINRAILSKRGNGHGIKAADAIHLASAKRLKVGEFHTTDKKLLALQNEMGAELTSILDFTICEPNAKDRLIFPSSESGKAAEAEPS